MWLKYHLCFMGFPNEWSHVLRDLLINPEGVTVSLDPMALRFSSWCPYTPQKGTNSKGRATHEPQGHGDVAAMTLVKVWGPLHFVACC